MNLDGYRIRPDALFRRAGVVVELDGKHAHRILSRFESDRVRDRKLRAHGLVAVRVTARQLAEPAEAEDLEGDLRRLGVARRDTVPA